VSVRFFRTAVGFVTAVAFVVRATGLARADELAQGTQEHDPAPSAPAPEAGPAPTPASPSVPRVLVHVRGAPEGSLEIWVPSTPTKSSVADSPLHWSFVCAAPCDKLLPRG